MEIRDVKKIISIVNKEKVSYKEAETLLKYADMDQKQYNAKWFLNENILEFYRKIMEKVEQENLLPILLDGLKNEDDRRTCIMFLRYTKHTDEIKRILDEEELKDLSRTDFADLMIATKDPSFLEYFESKKVENKFLNSLTDLDLVDFALYSKDGNFIKSLIENRYERKDIKLEVRTIITLLEELDEPEYVKKILNMNNPIYNPVFDDGQNLNKSSNLRDFFYKASSKNIVKLLELTKDNEFIKNILSSPEIIDSPNTIYKKFSKEEIVDLVCFTKDPDFIKEVINSEELRENIRLNIETNKEKKEIYTKLINATGDVDYIKSIINDEQKREELKIKNVTKLIIGTNDIDYIKEIISDNSLKDSLGLYRPNIISLVFATKDSEYINNYFRTLDLSIKEETKMLRPLELDKIRFFVQKTTEKKIIPIESKITIPENMTFGIEIETEGKNSRFIKPEIMDGWDCDLDGTLDDGMEVKSPILKKNVDSPEEKIRRACTVLDLINQGVSNNCGAHVHIGADFLTSDESFSKLAELWCNTEEVLYIISNNENEKPRVGIFSNAKPISRDIEHKAKQYENRVPYPKVKYFLKGAQSDREYGINFLNVDNRLNTIEFRLANGTINPETWIQNINLFGGIVAASEYISKIEKKKESDITPYEKSFLDGFEKLKDENISESDRLEILLSLAIPEVDRDIYRRRYYINKRIIDNEEPLNAKLKRYISRKPVNLVNIVNKIFNGSRAITGIDYDFGKSIIEQDLKYTIEEENKSKEEKDNKDKVD